MTRSTFAVVTSLMMGSLCATPVIAQDTLLTTPEFVAPEYTSEELDNLVSPVALYPDALLAQVLVASTFPAQIEDAMAWVRRNGTDGIDDQPWDVSVKAVAHYPSALNMLAEKIDWTATLGQAYAYQSSDVMLAVQRMRALADSHGNLVTTEEQEVVREGDQYIIAPAQPQVIYVPVYDPLVVYSRPIFDLGFHSPFWSFGLGFPIGGWLVYDFDWRRRSLFYHGWNHRYFGWGGGWRGRSFPFVQVNNIYVNSRYRGVPFNRFVGRHYVDYRQLDRYPRVHGNVNFSDRRGRDRDVVRTTERARIERSNAARDVTGRMERLTTSRSDRASSATSALRAGGRSPAQSSAATAAQAFRENARLRTTAEPRASVPRPDVSRPTAPRAVGGGQSLSSPGRAAVDSRARAPGNLGGLERPTRQTNRSVGTPSATPRTAPSQPARVVPRAAPAPSPRTAPSQPARATPRAAPAPRPSSSAATSRPQRPQRVERAIGTSVSPPARSASPSRPSSSGAVRSSTPSRPSSGAVRGSTPSRPSSGAVRSGGASRPSSSGAVRGSSSGRAGAGAGAAAAARGGGSGSGSSSGSVGRRGGN